MPPLDSSPENPGAWLAHARSDLAVACIELPDGAYYETLSWHALQAAEKALKAVLIHLGVEYPRTHVIEKLIRLIPADIQVPDEVKRAARLSAFLLQRYPGDHEEIEKEEHLDAVKSAKDVMCWAEEIIG